MGPLVCCNERDERRNGSGKEVPRLARDSNPKDQYRHLQPKRRGELAEAAFLLKAATLGFSVAKPWGESDRYDFIVENGVHSWRVQIKSAFKRGTHNYCIKAAHNTTKYDVGEVDFLIAAIVPENAWYVIPLNVFSRSDSISLTPNSPRRKSRFEKYREAWCLMACPKDGECRKGIDFSEDCRRVAAGEARCPNDADQGRS